MSEDLLRFDAANQAAHVEIADAPAGGNIWRMNADGSNEVQLTFNTQPEIAPAFSREGIGSPSPVRLRS